MESIKFRYTGNASNKALVRIVNNLVCPDNSGASQNSIRTNKAENHGFANVAIKNLTGAALDFAIPAAPLLTGGSTNPLTEYPVSIPNPSHAEVIVLDVHQISKVSEETKLDLKTSGSKSCLFLDAAVKDIRRIILKYDGSPGSVQSIKGFSDLFPETAKNSQFTSLISPNSLKKNQVLLEKRFVKKMTPLYGELGFIKLPLKTINDFIGFASQTKGDLIILPPSDLNNLLKHLNSTKFNKNNPHPVCFYVG